METKIIKNTYIVVHLKNNTAHLPGLGTGEAQLNPLFPALGAL
jgi:hypothetical protein